MFNKRSIKNKTVYINGNDDVHCAEFVDCTIIITKCKLHCPKFVDSKVGIRSSNVHCPKYYNDSITKKQKALLEQRAQILKQIEELNELNEQLAQLEFKLDKLDEYNDD